MNKVLIDSTRWTLGLALICGFSAMMEAQDSDLPTQDGLPVFAETLEVNIVNLNLLVVDKDGNPVTGLTPSDFQITDNGDPVAITNFREVREGQILDIDPVDTEAEPVKRPNPDPVYVALLFDHQSLEKRNRNRVIESFRTFMPQWLDRGGQFLFATAISSDGPEIVQGFTSDPQKVEAALSTIEEMPAVGGVLKNRKRVLKRDMFRIQLAASRAGPGGAYLSTDRGLAEAQVLIRQVETMRNQENDRIQQALVSIDDVCRGLTGLSGRKHMVYVGQALAMRPGIDVYSAFYKRFRMFEQDLNIDPPELWGLEMDLNPIFKRLAGGAHGSEVVMHMVDAADHDSEAGNADFGASDKISVTMSENADGGSTYTPGVDLTSLRTLFEGSQYVSGVTGGDAFFNSRNFDAFFETLDRQVSNYYSLAYTLDGAADGELHKVKIEVEGKGYKVKHHELYRNRTADQRLYDRAHSQLSLGIGENDLGIRLSLADGQPGAEGEGYVQSIIVGFPTKKVGLLPEGEVFKAKIKLLVLVEDDEGDRSPSQVIPVELNIPTARLESIPVAGTRVRLKIKNASSKIVVAAKDETTGMEGVALLRVIQPKT